MEDVKKLFKEDINFLEYPNWVIDKKSKITIWSVQKENGRYEVSSPHGIPTHFDKLVLYFLLHKQDKKQILDSFKDYKKRTIGGTYYSTKIKSTYEEFTQNPKLRAQVENQYRALLIAELILAAKNKDTKLVARIAKDVGLTPNIALDLEEPEKKPTRKRKK